jgi:dTDP-4-amino-4,6-dideoxygalactose transaminase
MKRIPMIDLAAEYRLLEAEIAPVVRSVMARGQYTLGPQVADLEAAIADYCQVKHAIALGSGTDALVVALRAAGIKPGDEVVTSAFTFIASASAIALCGATPVFADIDARTFNITAESVAGVLTERTRAVIPVHLFGQPVDLAPIATLCRPRGIALIEDAAQAFGARIDGRKVGTLGDAGCFSFYPTKNLGAFGDGGMMITDDGDLAARARMLANHGRDAGQRAVLLGYNSRLDELQAAILRVKLRHVDAFNASRRRHAGTYNAYLADAAVTLPFEDGVGQHVYHQYTLRSDRREGIRQALSAAGVASGVYYPEPLHRQAPLAGRGAAACLPATEQAAREVLSLPMSPLLSDADIERVAQIVRSAVS